MIQNLEKQNNNPCNTFPNYGKKKKPDRQTHTVEKIGLNLPEV